MLEAIEALGGIRYLSASHVHGYGALWQLQERFAPEQLALHKADLQLSKAFRVTHPFDDTWALAEGYTLHHVGGHYEGQSLLHDAHHRRVFCGDMFKVDQDAEGRAQALSAHKAFHKNIPLTAAELRHYRTVLAPLAFDSLCTPFEFAPEVGRALALAALDRMLAAPPAVTCYPLSELQ